LSVSILLFTLFGCGPATESGDVDDRGSEKDAEPGPKNNNAENLAKMAFNYLKTGDEDCLEHIWVTPKLMERLAEISGQAVPPENLREHQEAIVESAKMVRREAEELGIDWADAKLFKAEWDATGELTKYAPPTGEGVVASSQIDLFEVYITVKSGETTVTLRLDDCLNIDGKHVIGDCFMAPTMEGW
jgi:hypothetical protein